MVYRFRTATREIGIPNDEDLIVSGKNTYYWNKNLKYEFDFEIFEELYKKTFDESFTKEESLKAALEAFKLYKGEFLPKLNLEQWVIPLNTYYKKCYLDLIDYIIKSMNEMHNYKEIINICKSAVKIEKYNENLYKELIIAYINMNCYNEARNIYKDVCNIFYNKFGIELSDKFKQLYIKIMENDRKIQMEINEIANELVDDELNQNVFLCEYEVFKSIYNLQRRTINRSGRSAFLVLLTLTDNNFEVLSNKYISAEMDRLLEIIARSIRRSDIITRYSPTQYLLMLLTPQYEFAVNVIERVIKAYNKDCPKNKVKISYSLHPITSLFEKG